MSALQRLLASWGALDVRSLALFRIGLAVAILCDCATRAVDARAFLSDEGVVPRALWFALANDTWSLHVAIGSPGGQLALLAVAALVATALLVGWRTRAAAIVSLVLLVSLQNRNSQVFYGFDLLLRTSLLWACFLPLGARWSLDARRSRQAPDAFVSAATLALTLQMVFVYVASGLQKTQDASWRSLDAVWLGLTTDNHATSLARVLAASLETTRALSAAVLALELVVPFLLLVPLRGRARDEARLFVVAAFVLFHVGTALVFEIGLFPLAGVVAWLPFLPSRVWPAGTARSARDGGRTDDVTWGTSRAAAALAGALIVVVLASNVESVTAHSLMPAWLKRAAAIARVEQNWNMFERPMADGWFLARATRADGSTIDLLKGGAPVTLEKPASVASTFSSMRWRKYVTGLVRASGARHRRAFLRWLCAEWRQTTGERLATVELVMMEETESPTRPSMTTVRTLATVQCR